MSSTILQKKKKESFQKVLRSIRFPVYWRSYVIDIRKKQSGR